jgi:hypothetical protein
MSQSNLCMSLVLGLLASTAAQAAERASSKTARIAANDQIRLEFPNSSSVARGVRQAQPALVAPTVVERVEELPLPPAPRTMLAAPWQGTAPARILTHREFAAAFQPLPGNYEVVLLHPYTRRPVKVCFSLPHGCIKEVEVDRNELQFDYGKFEVEVRFRRCGRVDVDLDD